MVRGFRILVSIYTANQIWVVTALSGTSWPGAKVVALLWAGQRMR
jgi:hypothetical protein